MDPISPHNSFGPKFKHAKGVDIVIGDIESFYTYPQYCKSSLVTHLLVWNINHHFQLAKGWNFHQSEFWNSDLMGSTDGEHSPMLLKPPNIILNPSTYAYVTNQPWNHMLDNVNPVNPAVTMGQTEQPDEP